MYTPQQLEHINEVLKNHIEDPSVLYEIMFALSDTPEEKPTEPLDFSSGVTE